MQITTGHALTCLRPPPQSWFHSSIISLFSLLLIHLLISLYIFPQTNILTSYRPYMDPTSTLFFNTASWIVKLYTSTSTFPLFSHHHHHISIVSPLPPPPRPPPPPPPSHFYYIAFPTPPHFYCFHSSCCYPATKVIWVWLFWPDFGLLGLILACLVEKQ